MNRSRVGAVVALLLACGVGHAQIENVRISEVSPSTGEVEITNTGGPFDTAANRPFCHRFNYVSSVPPGFPFGAGEIVVVDIPALNSSSSDLWLYTVGTFAAADAMVHGLKFGSASAIGRTSVAVNANLWPALADFVPTPPSGQSIAWDGFGIGALDWYIDETPSLGTPDSTLVGSVGNSLMAPSSIQDFEGVQLGDEVVAIDGWSVVNDAAPGVFTVRAAPDWGSAIAPRPGSASTRWLRVRDQDGAGTNRFYGPAVETGGDLGYAWTFHVNIEEPADPGAASNPRIMIQHDDSGFANAWGIEFTSGGGNLVVASTGGIPASATLFPLASPTGLGEWVEVTLAVDFAAGAVSASINGGVPTTLPINPAPTASKDTFRVCYRGEGAGNTGTMLIDDLGIEVEAGAACACEFTGDEPSDVDVTDLLAFLALWFDDDPGAEVTGDEPASIDVSDLLTFLACWFPVQVGGDCP